jgi:hypothetical protein
VTKHSTRQRRRNLWVADPHCWWCGRLTRYASRKGGKAARKAGYQDPDLATVDHLATWRNRPPGVDRRRLPEVTVLACRECNRDRGRISDALRRAREAEAAA